MKTKILMVALMLLAMTPAIQAKSLTKTVAHRGYWNCEGSAENSLASLRKAHDVGCWGSELDIWLTSDGGLVVNHDPKTLDGLKNGFQDHNEVEIEKRGDRSFFEGLFKSRKEVETHDIGAGT